MELQCTVSQDMEDWYIYWRVLEANGSRHTAILREVGVIWVEASHSFIC